MSRTASGRWRAVNMMRSAPTKGAHVISESTGSLVIVTGSARPAALRGWPESDAHRLRSACRFSLRGPHRSARPAALRGWPESDAHRLRSACRFSLRGPHGSARPVLTVGGLRKARVASSPPPLGPDEEQQDAEGDPIDIVLRLPALDAPHEVASAQRPRGQEVQHTVHEVAIDPADQA